MDALAIPFQDDKDMSPNQSSSNTTTDNSKRRRSCRRRVADEKNRLRKSYFSPDKPNPKIPNYIPKPQISPA
jgi:hypothetical protein